MGDLITTVLVGLPFLVEDLRGGKTALWLYGALIWMMGHGKGSGVVLGKLWISWGWSESTLDQRNYHCL